jgi:hypothetical protein
MIMFRKMIVAIIIVFGLMSIAVTGFAPNTSAYYYDDHIDYATLYFGDGTNATITEGGQYNLTVNQTSIIEIYIYSDFQYTYVANTTYDEMIGITIVSPNKITTNLYAIPTGEWVLEPVGDMYYVRGGLITNETYNITHDGLFTIEMQHWMLINDTALYSDNYDFMLSAGGSVASGVLFMGDWEFFEISMGFIGVIGFAATPFLAARLGSSKDPIVLISAVMICMMVFGVFIYVFLLGGT